MRSFFNSLKIVFFSFAVNILIFMLSAWIDVITGEAGTGFGIAIIVEAVCCFALPIVYLKAENRFCEEFEMPAWKCCLFLFIGNIAADTAAIIWICTVDMNKLFSSESLVNFEGMGLALILMIMIAGTVWALIFRGLTALIRYLRKF